MSTLIVGCGYLGRRVGRLLAERGEPVLGTVRTPEGAARLRPLGIEPVLADVLDPASLDRLSGARRVVYCVGLDRSKGVPMRTVYVDGLRNVLDRLGRVPEVFVYTSSTGVYGRNDGGWIAEDVPPEPTHEAGRVCLDAEEVVRAWARERGARAIVLRLAGLYGPGRVPHRATLERGEPIVGDPSKYLNLVHVDDAARATVAALERGVAGATYLVADDRPVERREFYGRVAEVLGCAPPRFVAPDAGSRQALREESNKRIANRRMREELGVDLEYPDNTIGLPAALGGRPDPSQD